MMSFCEMQHHEQQQEKMRTGSRGGRRSIKGKNDLYDSYGIVSFLDPKNGIWDWFHCSDYLHAHKFMK